MVDQRIVITLAVIAVVLAFRLAIGGILKRRLRELIGHQLLANMLTGVLSVGLVIYLLYVWGVIQAVVELMAAFGFIAAVVLFAVKDIWLNNLFAGISLIGDKLIDVGSEIEVAGKRGKIIEMTLTVTKVKTPDGNIVTVPNKKFREDIVVIKTKRR